MGLAKPWVQQVPGALVLVLCVGSFFVGRLTSEENAAKDELLTEQPGRVLQAGHQVSPPDKPLEDVPHLEQYFIQKSGLPWPQQPGKSGQNAYQAAPFQILSWWPRIVVYPAFVSKPDCEHVIQLARDMLYPSGLAYRPGEEIDPKQETRTSKGTFMSAMQDKKGVLAKVEERIAAVTRIPRSHGEAYNVLEYKHLQHYDSHMDSFDPKEFGPQPSQRIATVLVYLSDVEEGGETVFKKEGIHGDTRPVMDWKDCNDGSFKYQPRQGDAVLFYTVDPDQQINPRALHGGCPVIKGSKYVMTKWLHDNPLGPGED